MIDVDNIFDYLVEDALGLGEDDPSIHYQTPESIKRGDVEVFHDEDDSCYDDYCGPSNPLDALDDIKKDPSSINIAKMNGNYYLKYGDLKDYMNLNGIGQYEPAMNSIIRSHSTECDDMAPGTIKVAMSNEDVESLSNREKDIIESSAVEFEVYDNRYF